MRTTSFIILLALSGGFALADSGDIPLSSNFQQNSGRPLDSKIIEADSTTLNAIPGTLRYRGMIVYIRSTNNTYQLWGDTSTFVLMPATPNNDSIGGGFDAAEGLPAPGIVGGQVVYADSMTHTLHLIPNNQEDYVLVHSSVATPTNHGLVTWLAHGKTGDMGLPPWVVVPSTFSWSIPTTITFSSNVVINGGSTTITTPMTIIGFSTRTITNAYFDVSQSSTALGFIKLSNGYGTSGQVPTSGGTTSSATWASVSALSAPPDTAYTDHANLFTSSQTLVVSGNSVSQIVGISSSTTATPYLSVSTGGVVAIGGTAAFSYRQSAPAYPLDFECSTLDSVNCVNVSHSNGVAINASGTSNNPAIQASNNTSGLTASAIKASKVGASGFAADFETDQATAVFVNATTGTGIRAQATGGGNAIQVDQGNVRLNTLSANTNVCTDSGKNLTTSGCMSGTSISSNYTATSTDTYITASAVTATTTITLDAASAAAGQQIAVFKIDASSWPIKVVCAGSDKINGSTATFSLNAQGQSLAITSDGTSKWLAQTLMATPLELPTVNASINTTSTAQASSTTLLSAVYVPVPVRVTGCQFDPVVQGGLVDCGIYDTSSVLLSSTTPVGLGTANTLQTINFISAVTLPPGTYYMALGVSAATIQFKGWNCAWNCLTTSANFPLATGVSLATPYALVGAMPAMRLIVTGGSSL